MSITSVSSSVANAPTPTFSSTSTPATTSVPPPVLGSDGQLYPASSFDSTGQLVGPALTTSPTSSTYVSGGNSTNPTSRGVNDISDIRPGSTQISLPIRAEKRILPNNANTLSIYESGQVSSSDFYVTAAARTFYDYMKIRIPHRGFNLTTQLPDTTQDVEFRFLINPKTITVNRQTVDTNSLTRGGWQFGVWGEDAFHVQLSGQSAGSYFTNGLTDEYSYFSVSYRNLMQLQELFENNGYWFEGEEYNEGPLAADYLRRRIRMHQDVELWVGNFIWSGMFDSFSIAQDASNPFLLDFQLDFFVWKERFKSTSPYWGSIVNNVQRGQSYSAVEGASAQQEINNTLSQYAPMGVTAASSQAASTVPSQYSLSPAVQSASADDVIPTVSGDTMGFIGTQPASATIYPSTSIPYYLGVTNP